MCTVPGYMYIHNNVCTHMTYTHIHIIKYTYIYTVARYILVIIIFLYPEPGAPSIFIISLLLNLNRLLSWESQKFSQFFT